MSDYFQDENQNEKKVYTGTVENPYGGTVENPYGGGSEPDNGFGIAALILGIVSMVFFCSCLTYITAPLAIIFGIVQLVKSKKGKGLAIAGLITGIISLVACIAFWVILTGNTALSDSILDEYGDYDFEDPDSIEQFIEDYGNNFGGSIEDDYDDFEDDRWFIEEGGYKPL
jgi:hypothetical protein